MNRPHWEPPDTVEHLRPKSYFDADTTPLLDAEDREDAVYPFFRGIAEVAQGVYEFEQTNARLCIIRNQLRAVSRQLKRQGWKGGVADIIAGMELAIDKAMVQYDRKAYTLSESMFERMRAIKDLHLDGNSYEG